MEPSKILYPDSAKETIEAPSQNTFGNRTSHLQPSPPFAPFKDTTAGDPTSPHSPGQPLTELNLTMHSRQAESVWRSKNECHKSRVEKFARLVIALQSLDANIVTDLGPVLISKVATNNEGMKPMERYLSG
ncbi:hypothetical protein AJ79_02787 [Helicocarpus griseus UAMH5409]|uniref:Uncharacterized protein n=1 Tax=Helicocarpus griseus UAMH5409 TaxID=1447875 RepID=A0A2B7XT33_9EURO|nr:hypothetical protein AJ79_02787 [Helicocarpus griseus UAMH5409]